MLIQGNPNRAILSNANLKPYLTVRGYKMSNMKDEICRLFRDTTMTQQCIADTLGTTAKVVFSTTKKNFTKEFRLNRKKLNYRESRIGDKNPMYGKTGSYHHNFIGTVSDGKGYLMVLKPDWYTGRKGTKHIFEHHKNYCLANGLTCIPKGYIVHHKDGVKTNNHPSNLIMMTMSDHMKLHARLRCAETIRKE